MAKSVKLSDIASRAGVSSVTVSKALADKQGVSEEKRVEIKRIAQELGYASVSQNRPKNSTGNIGIVIPCRYVDRSNSFYWAMYQQVVTKLTYEGYYAILELLQYEDEQKSVLPNMVKDRKIDGLIVIGQIDKKYSEYLWNEDSISTVFLDFYDTHTNYDTVISDGFYGMYIMASHMIRNGHRDIGFVGTLLTTSSITDRYFGYQKALMENGLQVRKDWIVADRDPKSGVLIDIELPSELPTAFVCNCDYSAGYLINKLNEAGFQVPKDVSVTGFDNYLHPNLNNYQITTYEVKMDKMAELCTKTLLAKINNEPYIQGIQIVTGELVLKESVRPYSTKNL